jgi:hypothetical protein
LTPVFESDRYLDAVVQSAKATPEWFAAWDPARHAVALSTVEVAIAKGLI